MAEYYDCIAFIKTKNDKTIARQIGSAKKRDDGGFNVYLDALPVNGNFAIVPARQKQASTPARTGTAFKRDEMDDEVPF